MNALFVCNADGSNERRLASRKRPAFFSNDGPSWSPDGEIIALSYGDLSASGRFMSVAGISAADGSQRPLSAVNWAWVGQVQWLPDGSGLVAVAWDKSSPLYSDQIWSLRYPGGEAHKITNDLNGYGCLTLSNDARTLVTVQTTRVSQIWVAPNGEAEQARPVTTGFGDNYSELYGMSWMPDGRIVYVSQSTGNPEIWVIDHNGANRKQLTADPHSDLTPACSPDARHIVFVSARSGSLNVWRMNADGSDQTRLTFDAADESPTFSADGKSIVYTNLGPEGAGLFRVPIESGTPQRITSTLARRPVVSPDGTRIACYLK